MAPRASPSPPQVGQISGDWISKRRSVPRNASSNETSIRCSMSEPLVGAVVKPVERLLLTLPLGREKTESKIVPKSPPSNSYSTCVSPPERVEVNRRLEPPGRGGGSSPVYPASR